MTLRAVAIALIITTSSTPAASLEERVHALAAANDEAGLRELLEDLRAHPVETATTDKSVELRLQALVALAQIQLETKPTDAKATIDEAIRIARGSSLPIVDHEALSELIKARLQDPSNAPLGELLVACESPCHVILDERSAGVGAEVVTRGIPLGPHRLYLRDAEDADHSLATTFELSRDEPRYQTRLAAPPSLIDTNPSSDSSHPAPRRRLPRWAGLVGMGAGVAAAIAGGVLLGFDGRCPDGSDAATSDCPDVLSTQTSGAVLLAVGGGLMVGFAIPFAIGEQRQKAHRRALSWTYPSASPPLRP